jgi:hypothetical protein
MARKPWKQACNDVVEWWAECDEREAAGKKSFRGLSIPKWRNKWRDSYNRCVGLAAADQVSAEAIAEAEAAIDESDYETEANLAALDAQTQNLIYGAIVVVITVLLGTIGYGYVRKR